MPKLKLKIVCCQWLSVKQHLNHQSGAFTSLRQIPCNYDNQSGHEKKKKGVYKQYILHSDSYFCRCLGGTWFLSLSDLEQWQQAGAKQSAALLQLWMDGCKAALLQPKQLFNHTKRLHLLDHLWFYLKSHPLPVTLLRSLSNAQAHTGAEALVYIAISVPATIAHLF